MTKIIQISVFVLSVVCVSFANQDGTGQVIHRKAKDTITPVELGIGEAVQYTRKDGEILTLKLEDTDAAILYTNLDKIKDDEPRNERGTPWRSRTLYHFTCRLLVNGHPMTMERYVGSQESFYVPYIINGVRIWFDGVSDIFEADGGFLKENHGACSPNKKGRFVLGDMEMQICPQSIGPWYFEKENYIDIGRCFSGDDPWMGAFLGLEAHGGLDINMRKGMRITAPVDFDKIIDQTKQTSSRYSLSNCFQIRNWDNGSKWKMRVGHLMKLLVPLNEPIKQGTSFALGAGARVWWHDHSHFGIQIEENNEKYLVDPWILFWQIFENEKEKTGDTKANMAAFRTANTGESIQFAPAGSRAGKGQQRLDYYWTFGDGGWSDEQKPNHVFAKAGIYPVTLTIDDGKSLASMTQHITIEGAAVKNPVLSLQSENEPSFRRRGLHVMDVYGWEPKLVPHTLSFVARHRRPIPEARTISPANLGDGCFAQASCTVKYHKAGGWLKLDVTGKGNEQNIKVTANAGNLNFGEYSAVVNVDCPGALNSPQKFRVVLRITDKEPQASVTIDDRDDGFYCTPYFWVGFRFHGWGWPKLGAGEGNGNFYLLNGKRAGKGEFARFSPDLAAGKYEISLNKSTPFKGGFAAHDAGRFRIRVHHANGDDLLWMEPDKSLVVGTFEFNEGTDGFVEILAENSQGQVLVDAIDFVKK